MNSGNTNKTDDKTDGKKKWLTTGYTRSLPELSNPDNFVRGDDGCYELIHSSAWGTTLIKIEDPEGQKITVEDKKAFKLIPNFPRVPKEIWSAWIGLCFALCDKKSYAEYGQGYYSQGSDNEVSIVLLRHEDDLTKWKAIVPKQTVSGAAVHADFDESCDLLTGEKYNVFPPPGWLHVGSSHSHNTMGAFFSGTDNRSELGIPGLHIVVGGISKKKLEYTYKASIVLRGQRKIIDNLEDVVDHTPLASPFHIDCLGMIDEHVSVTPSSTYRGGHNYDHSSGNHHMGYGSGSSYSEHSKRTYKPGSLWDNDKHEWVYPEELDKVSEEDCEIILLPGELNKIGKNLHSGEAYEEYLRITDEDYGVTQSDFKFLDKLDFEDEDMSILDGLDDETRRDLEEYVGKKLAGEDEEWLKYYLSIRQDDDDDDDDDDITVTDFLRNAHKPIADNEDNYYHGFGTD